MPSISTVRQKEAAPPQGLGLALLADKLELHGALWDRIAMLNEHMGVVGYASVAMFVAIWGLSVLNYRYRRYDRLTA
ncbi:MAG: hypothetical protein KIB04_09035 [Pantoea sp.]|nr:hypothetical protein [Pantoea sp.]